MLFIILMCTYNYSNTSSKNVLLSRELRKSTWVTRRFVVLFNFIFFFSVKKAHRLNHFKHYIYTERQLMYVQLAIKLLILLAIGNILIQIIQTMTTSGRTFKTKRSRYLRHIFKPMRAWEINSNLCMSCINLNIEKKTTWLRPQRGSLRILMTGLQQLALLCCPVKSLWRL